jgi:hypothetical protein
MMRNLTYLCVLLCLSWHCQAQRISGILLDRETGDPMGMVQLTNIHQQVTVFSDSTGHFSINANRGELVELRQVGYRMTNIRIPKGYVPSYFKILMDKTVLLSTDIYASSKLTEFQKDSIREHELYKTALRKPRLSTLESIESPFSALSKSNREVWAFQESFAYFEKEKYIDFNFSPQLVTNLTGLTGDSLVVYMRRFRPNYEALRTMKTYDFYNYIKQSAELYRRRSRSTPRSSR